MANRENCRCLEAFVDGERVANSPHDCDYVEARNKLIPVATARANDRCRTVDGGLKLNWFDEFQQAMAEVAFENGLVKFPPRPRGVEWVVPVKLNPLPFRIRPIRHNKPHAD